jgi:RHS repeat-associated protein
MAVTPQGGSTVNTSYTWDNANRLNGIYQGSGGCASSGNPAVRFAYDNANRRTTLTLPNGVTVSYSYDKDSRVSLLNYGMGSTQLGQLSYYYDADGRVTGKGGTLASISLPQSLNGNLFNADNAMTTFGSQSLSYEANGNLTSDGTNTYNWDARNHLTSISGAVSASFVGACPERSRRNAFGRRMSKTISGTTTQFLYDRLNPVQELDNATPPDVTASVLTGLNIDEYFSRTDSSGAMSFLRDTLGSTLALADSSGAIGTTYTYEPFGKTTPGGPANANPYQFTGRENDSTGAYFYRARYYSPTYQRFVSQDPLGFAGGDRNLYRFVLDDPVLLRDPSGKLPIGVGVGGAVGGVEGGIGAYLQGGAFSDIVTSAVVGAAVGCCAGSFRPNRRGADHWLNRRNWGWIGGFWRPRGAVDSANWKSL